MAKVLVSVIYGFLHTLGGAFLFPLYTLIDTLLETLNLTNYVHLFQNILTTYIAPLVGFFFQFMGPNTISVIMLEFSVTILYFGIMLSTTFVIKVLRIIKKLPLA